jgi:hypothetical protein
MILGRLVERQNFSNFALLDFESWAKIYKSNAKRVSMKHPITLQSLPVLVALF